MTTIPIEIDPVILEHFETIAPDGTFFEGFIAGSRIILPGHIKAGEAALQARALAAFSQGAGWLPEHITREDVQRINARGVFHLWAVPNLHVEDGEVFFDLVWHDQQLLDQLLTDEIDPASSINATALTRDSIPVTVVEL